MTAFKLTTWRMQLARGALAASAALILSQAGCGSNNSGDSAGVGGYVGSGGSSGAYCPLTTTCECDDGRRGSTRCEGDGAATRLVCDCSHCPPFAVKATRGFAACGWSSIGAWRLVSYELGGAVQISVDSQTGGLRNVGTCYAQVSPSGTVQVPSGVIYVRTPEFYGFVETQRLVYEAQIAETCVKRAVSRVYALEPTSPSGCLEQECGLLSCVFDAAPTDGRMMTQLGCESGTTLTTFDPWSETTYVWESLVLGAPVPCHLRSVETCELDTANHTSGCHIGECHFAGALSDSTGALMCQEARDRAKCGAIKNCYWDTAVCAGKAPVGCVQRDFESTPWCKVYPLGTQCTGTPTPCSKYSLAMCPMISGCEVGSEACIGDNPNCANLTPLNCAQVSSCTLTRCHGTAPACEGLPISECEALGCTLQVL